MEAKPLVSPSPPSTAHTEAASRHLATEKTPHAMQDTTSPANDAAEDAKPQPESFKVFARLRPVSAGQKSTGDMRVVRSHGQQSIIQAKNLEFLLDRVWDATDTQENVYANGIKERVGWVLGGFNTTVICYGQTGSGKTHTMFGPDDVFDKFHNPATSDKFHHGILPRACGQLFEAMQRAAREVTFVVHVSYVEAYNDGLKDLLSRDGKRHVVLRESAKGLDVQGQTHQLVSSPSEVMRAVMRGNAHRVVAAMKMNDRSSRGHALITISVKEVTGEGTGRTGRLTLVDLAGMESSKKSYAVEGASTAPARQEEMKHINQSLWALGTVIERLSSGGAGAHVPYRDSKLTRLLQTSLTGGGKIAFVATLRAEEANIEESIGTLRFAQRCKAIRVVVKRKEAAGDPEQLQKMLDKAQEQLKMARSQISEMEVALARSASEAEEKATAAAQAAQEAHGGADDGELQQRIAALEQELSQERRQSIERKSQATLQASLLHKRDAAAKEAAEQLETIRAAQQELEEALSLRDAELREANDALEAFEAGGGGLSTPSGRRSSGAGGETDSRSTRTPASRRPHSSIAKRVSGEGLDGNSPDGADADDDGETGHGGSGGEGLSDGEGMLSKDGMGIGGSPLGGRRSPALTAAEERYKQFVALANARKLALAAQGFELEHVFIDELFDAAEKHKVPVERWPDFLQEEIPFPDSDAATASRLEESVAARSPAGASDVSSPGLLGAASPDPTGRRGQKRTSIQNWQLARATAQFAFRSAIDARKEMRKRGGLPSPVVRRASIVPDGVHPAEGSAADVKARLESEAAARAEEEMSRLRGSPPRTPARQGSSGRGRTHGGAETPDAAGGQAAARRGWRGWLRSSDAWRVALALCVLLVYFARRTQRLGPDAAFSLGGAPAPSTTTSLAVDRLGGGGAGGGGSTLPDDVCRWDWRALGCVDVQAPLLAELGYACASRPTPGQPLRCRAVREAAARHGDCTAHAAGVLYRVASELRAECVADGTCVGSAGQSGGESPARLGPP